MGNNSTTIHDSHLQPFFGKLAQVPSDGIPYPLFSYTALVPWTFFANGFTLASNSIVNNADMIRKIYFSRMSLPIATVFAGLVDFTLAFIVLIGMIIGFSIVPAANYEAQISLKVLWLHLFLLLALVTTLGVSFWFSAVNAQFCDVRFIIPFFIQAWFYLTPFALHEEPAQRRRHLDLSHNYRQLLISLPNL